MIVQTLLYIEKSISNQKWRKEEDFQTNKVQILDQNCKENLVFLLSNPKLLQCQ